MKQNIYCPQCGRNRWHHLLSNPCRHRQAAPKTRDWSGLVAWGIIGATVAWVLYLLPW